jgi:lysophospholipase L1-like esterase
MLGGLVAILSMASRASPQAQALVSGHGLARCSASRWVGSWTASPTDAQTSFDASLNVLSFGDRQTFRMILSPHFGGDRVRLHLSNRFGTRPVTFNRVRLALQRSGASLVPGSSRRVHFAGRSAVTVPAGHDVVSDPLRLSFAPFDDLAVSIYVDRSPGIPTEHWSARQTSYLTAPGAGNKTAARRGASFSQPTTARYYVDGLDVRAPRRVGSVVALGASITDGFQGPPNLVPEDPGSIDRNQRYPDFLARRLLAHPRPLSVLNAGITGNRVLADGYYPYFGRSAISRLRADVLRQAGVTDVIVEEGLNDIGQTPGITAAAIIDGYKRMIARIHAAGLRVQLGTLTPMRGASVPSYGSAAANALRRAVNKWIRNQNRSNGVIDFAHAVRDPDNRSHLAPRYDGGDHLHLNPRGYRRLARAVSLGELARPRCAR